MFNYIKDILISELSNENKQIKIERSLRYYWKEEFEKLTKNSDLNSTKYGLNIFIREFFFTFIRYINFIIILF